MITHLILVCKYIYKKFKQLYDTLDRFFSMNFRNKPPAPGNKFFRENFNILRTFKEDFKELLRQMAYNLFKGFTLLIFFWATIHFYFEYFQSLYMIYIENKDVSFIFNKELHNMINTYGYIVLYPICCVIVYFALIHIFRKFTTQWVQLFKNVFKKKNK